MSIAYCSNCERIVEGNTMNGVEITINRLTGTKIKRSFECCQFCGIEVTHLNEDEPDDDMV